MRPFYLARSVGRVLSSLESVFKTIRSQSCTQRPQALWQAVGRQERVWGTAGFLR